MRYSGCQFNHQRFSYLLDTKEPHMSTTTSPAIQVTDLSAGTWDIDASHSEVGFQVRHLITKVRGHFSEFAGTTNTFGDAPSTITGTKSLT